MKYLLSLGLLALFMYGSAQDQYELIPNEGHYEFNRSQSDDHLRAEEVIWEQDFSNGIPTVWPNQDYNDQLQLTQAKWEWRGPSTTPSTSVGSTGNCVENGTSEGAAIESPTANNGFIIFDSDGWDSTEGDCGSFGTGAAAAPHSASLTTGSFNFADEPYVGLIFNQYLKNFDASMKVQASLNGGEFQDLYINPFTASNASSSRDMQVRKNISDVVGNQSDVKLRFLFEGTYYFWMIDDLKIVRLLENNLVIRQEKHGALDIASSSDFENYNGLEYFQYPLSMINELELFAQAENQGGVSQTSSSLAVALQADGAEIESTSSNSSGVAPEEVAVYDAGNLTLPEEVNEYQLVYTVSQIEEEQSPDDNTITNTIRITENTLARDEGMTDSYFTPSEEYNGVGYEVGTVYVPTVADLELYSISAGISNTSITGSACYAALYTVVASEGVTLTPVATSGFSTVEPWHLNNFGDEQMMVFDFDTPITLEEGTAYLAVVGTFDGPETVTFAFSGDSQPLTSFAKYQNNDISFLERTPMVRMNFDQVTSIENSLNGNISVNVFPNPADDYVTVDFILNSSSEMIIGLFDINGKHIENLYEGVNGTGSHQLKVNVSSMAPGAYIIKVNTEYGKIEKPIIIE